MLERRVVLHSEAAGVYAVPHPWGAGPGLLPLSGRWAPDRPVREIDLGNAAVARLGAPVIPPGERIELRPDGDTGAERPVVTDRRRTAVVPNGEHHALGRHARAGRLPARPGGHTGAPPPPAPPRAAGGHGGGAAPPGPPPPAPGGPGC